MLGKIIYIFSILKAVLSYKMLMMWRLLSPSRLVIIAVIVNV